MAMNVKFLKGTIEEYGKVAHVDKNALYFCTDGKLYLGSNLIAEVNQTDATGVNNLITSAIEKLDADKTSTGGSFVNVQVVETDGQITEVKVNDAALATEFAKYQLKGDYKTKQASVADPTEKGKSLTFIDTIAQNTNGEIVATKKSVNLDNYSTTEQANGLYAAKAYEGKVDTLIGSDADKSVRTIANEELAAQLLSGNADADFKTLQDLAAWLEGHPEDVADINSALAAMKAEIGGTYVAGTGFTNSRIDANEAKLAGITDTVKKYVDDEIAKVDAAGVNEAIGNLQSGKADKVSGAVAGNFAGLDSEGNLTDSGKKADDFATKAQGELADSALQSVTIAGTTLTKASSTISKETISAALNLTGGTDSFDARIVATQSAIENLGVNLSTNYKTWTTTQSTIQGSTTNTVKDCVDAINALNAGTAQANKDINAISTSVNDVVNQLTWGTF